MLEYAICGSSQPPNKGTNDYCQTSVPWNNLIYNLGGGFKDFCMFTPIWGKGSIFDSYLQMGWFNRHLDNVFGCFFCSIYIFTSINIIYSQGRSTYAWNLSKEGDGTEASVDGSEIRLLHQLRLVVYPHYMYVYIYTRFYDYTLGTYVSQFL